MTRRNESDLRRDDDWLRWDDLVIAAMLIGTIVAAHFGWIH